MKKHTITYNFFGITALQKNPLPDAIKQALAQLLFVHPQITAAEAYMISTNYITESTVQEYMGRKQEELDAIDFRRVRSVMHKFFPEWLELFNYPLLEELVSIEKHYNNPKWDATDMELALYDSMKDAVDIGCERWIKYLNAFGEKMKMRSINRCLDAYNSEQKRQTNVSENPKIIAI
ncbi:MAG: hypothetical protein ACOCWG_00625 [bacterium]